MATTDISTARHAPSTTRLTLRINGSERSCEIDPRVTLLDALREYLGLTGTKKGCDRGECGACTVLLDGRRIDACLTFAVMQEGREITTITPCSRLSASGGSAMADPPLRNVSLPHQPLA
jgi:xanthine dehydrogenase iron-sulfur cluster and FAD-binding subunit A